MFGLFKKKDACIAWLSKLDKVYTDALRLRNPKLLEPYFTRRCLSKVVERINHGDNSLHGLERYRDVTFVLQSKYEEQSVYIKNISYKDIKMGYGVIMPVGESSDELWYVAESGGDFFVTDIKGV